MLIVIGALLLSAVIPFAIYLFLRNAHDDADYRHDCKMLLLNGLLLGFPVFGFSLLCNIVFEITHIGDTYPYVKAVFHAFVVLALSEELMKYLLAKQVIKKNLSTVSFLDLMAYTTIAAIGFEFMEGIVLVFMTNPGQIILRGVTCMHGAFGLVMGYFLAKSIKKGGKLSFVPAVLISTIMHGTYDFCLDPLVFETAWGDIAMLLAFLSLVLNIHNFFWMRKARKDPYYTEPLYPSDSEPTDHGALPED